MNNITSKEDFINLTFHERAGLLRALGLTHKYFQERHRKRRELPIHESTVASGVNGRNKKMLNFIAEEVVLFIKKSNTQKRRVA